jgi:hypothetical protein
MVNGNSEKTTASDDAVEPFQLFVVRFKQKRGCQNGPVAALKLMAGERAAHRRREMRLFGALMLAHRASSKRNSRARDLRFKNDSKVPRFTLVIIKPLTRRASRYSRFENELYFRDRWRTFFAVARVINSDSGPRFGTRHPRGVGSNGRYRALNDYAGAAADSQRLDDPVAGALITD